MQRSKILFLIFLLSGILVLWCTGGLCQSFPQRIISLGPSITEELYLLGVQDRLVGCTLYCKRPKEAETKEKVATVIEVNLERVVRLKPDLVLATALTHPRAIDKLRSLKIRVVSFSQAKNFTQICEQFLELGKIVDREKRAEEVINIVKRKVDFIKNEVRDLQKPKVFIQVGAKPLFTVTKDSFVNDFIEFAGGINIAKNSKSGLYSRERVIEQNPDHIIIVTMGIAGEQEKEIWQKYKAINAVKNNAIHIVNSYKLCSPTPVTFAQTLEEIVEILHPEKNLEKGIVK